MAKPEWGTKHTCTSCGVRFYDLLRSPITCSACGAIVEPKPILRPRNQPFPRTAVAAASLALVAAPEMTSDADAVEEVAVDAIDDDDESGLIEDTSDLVADDDDAANYVGAALEGEI